MKMDHWIDAFLEAAQAERSASVNTCLAYGRDLRRFSGFLRGQGKDFASAARADIENYLAELADGGLSPASRSRQLSAIRRLFAFACEEGWREDMPARHIQNPKQGRRLPGVLSAEEVSRLLDAAGKLGRTEADRLRNRCLFELFYATGARVSELAELPAAALRGRPQMLLIRGKGGKERMVPLTSPSQEAAENWLRIRDQAAGEGGTAGDRNSRYLFPSRGRCGHITRHQIYGLVKQAALAAGLDPARVSPHTMRHALATHLAGKRRGSAFPSGAARPFGRVDDGDLHPCRRKKAESAGSGTSPAGSGRRHCPLRHQNPFTVRQALVCRQFATGIEMAGTDNLADASIWIYAAAIGLLICLSALFSGSETALTSASRGKLRIQADKGDRAAARALRITGNRERLIGAVLLGNNLVNILAAALATSLFTKLFGDSGVAMATLVMTLLILFFAELLPKTYSITKPEAASRSVSSVISVIILLFHPMVAVLRWLAELALRSFGVRPDSTSPVKEAQEEIAGTIALVHSSGAIKKEYRDRVLGALDLGNLTVRDVMRHRSEIEMISDESSLESVIRICSASAHSRLPVHRAGTEEITGVIHAKDLLTDISGILEQQENMRDLFSDMQSWSVKQPYFVPETATLDEQLREFLENETHFALVVDEYGALQGLITLEDILEEIVGDITDEHDLDPETQPVVKTNGSFIIDGAVAIRDLNRDFDWRLPEENATTLAGLLIHEAQIIPNESQEFIYHGFRFEVLQRQAQRITRIKLTQL